MAAYAALLSLKHIIEQIQVHPRPPISLHQNQVHSLTDTLNFLQDFLEVYSCGGSSSSREAADVLESRIADAAHAAEDIIETRIVDQILGEKMSSDELYQDLEKVIQDMGYIKKELMENKEKNIGIIEDHLHINSSTLGGSSSSPSKRRDAVVGLDELLIEVMDKLTGQQSNLRIIPIVGMGGIGKTTLARNAYLKFMKHFDIRAWVTVSQNYNVREILVEILLCINKAESRETLSAKSEVNLFFPDNGERSRIMITTRLSNVASIGSGGVVMDFLNEDKSWDLLCRYVFEEEDDCSPELEEIGKKIAKNCEGLPLSIVVIGGHLAKSKRTKEHWEYISENLKKIVNSEDDERCLKVLQLSYNHLPVHLKPCFLYMGAFPEDNKIHVSWLVKLWVSEGFLKPINGKSLEVVSREYLEELCDRNLIRVHQRGSKGRIKYCNIHDLVRELCLREAEKEKFLYVRIPHDLNNVPQGVINTQRRIVLKAVDKHLYSEEKRQYKYPIEVVFRLFNSRFIAIRVDSRQNPQFPSSVNLLWNLQTLIVKDTVGAVAPSEIWKMTQLRHVEFDELEMPDPPLGGQDGEFVLGNLQRLSVITSFKCGEEVVTRIPNIEKLKIRYDKEFEGCSSYCLDNLCRLRKLESFGCSFLSQSVPNRDDMLQNFILPNSLKKLTLWRTKFYWEDMNTNIGLLPNLQVLKLSADACVGTEWETVEGQFCNLRYLLINSCSELEWWTTDSSHFPCLEHLVLQQLDKLNEIPSCIGEIPTLQSIELNLCHDDAVISAKRIFDEQEDLSLRVRVVTQNRQFESLAGPNFQVETW
ncbi:hypothetical protein MIMGU_mgv1a001470mg [Erythranthe guttata]|uniref:NB-ARC domain-containing protein n=1 Tax=Erythranthe guttata TaxID=4155 RepID=A0A022Q1Y5_ERYGU|nr:hypothetical protein MIMGU_mgv1a001470mg [Erythranthe guttata]